jgi:hypothetical protein
MLNRKKLSSTVLFFQLSSWDKVKHDEIYHKEEIRRREL